MLISYRLERDGSQPHNDNDGAEDTLVRLIEAEGRKEHTEQSHGEIACKRAYD